MQSEKKTRILQNHAETLAFVQERRRCGKGPEPTYLVDRQDNTSRQSKTDTGAVPNKSAAGLAMWEVILTPGPLSGTSAVKLRWTDRAIQCVATRKSAKIFLLFGQKKDAENSSRTPVVSSRRTGRQVQSTGRDLFVNTRGAIQSPPQGTGMQTHAQ